MEETFGDEVDEDLDAPEEKVGRTHHLLADGSCTRRTMA
jgi:hypothetical protein